MKITKRYLKRIIKEEIDSIDEGIFDYNPKEAAKNKIAAWIKSNSKDLSALFPVGTQTVAKRMIEAKSDEIADCVIEIASPV